MAQKNIKNTTRNFRLILGLFTIMVALFISQPVYGDGFIVVGPEGRIFPPPRPRPLPPVPPVHPFLLEVKYHRVNVDINGQVAVTSIDQVFFNPSHYRLEGYYLFPIPENAVIKKFSMDVNGKQMEAELLDAQKARGIYEDIVRRQLDPALLEYAGRGLFKARIFPIEPHSEKRVKISYQEILPKDNHTIEYIYPLNTEKFSAKPLNDVSVTVHLQSPDDIKNIYCPSHTVDTVRKGKKQAVISFEERNTKPDIDFKLYYSTDNQELGFSLLTYKKSQPEDGFFFLSLSPGYWSDAEGITEKDITFVLDVSGSMAGKKMNQAKKAMLFCIENLNKGDRFEIIRFSTEADGLFNKLAEVNNSNLDQAREFINNLKPIGGTNIDEALTMALDIEKRPGRPYMIVFLTDGKPTIGETDEDSLVKKINGKNRSNCRIFTFGIGNEINTHLLDKITELTRAYRTYITEEEDIEVKVSNFYTNVQSPVMTDLKLDFGSGIRVSKTYPRDLPDLFKGSSITLLGRYQGEGNGEIVLTGRVKDHEKTFRFKAQHGFKSDRETGSEKYDFIASLWAARRVGYLLDQVRLHGSDKELVDEITQLARTYGIITPYTSYLIVEDEQTNVRRNVIREQDQTLGLVAVGNGEFREKSRAEYEGMNSKSGAPSVQASREVQQLNAADNFAHTQTGGERLKYRQNNGQTRDINSQVKQVQGRAIYNVGNTWIDSHLQKYGQNQSVQRIQFASTDYFKLLKSQPQSAQFLALGKNVRFVMNNEVFEIFE